MSVRSRRAVVAGLSVLLVSIPSPLQATSVAAVAERAPGLQPIGLQPAPAVFLGPVRPVRAELGARPAVRRLSRPVRRASVPARRANVPVRRKSRVVLVARAAVLERASTSRASRSTTRVPAARPGLSAVVRYARAHVGARYVPNAAGPRAFDCSGFTMRAYAAAGKRLPHQSGAQAARAVTVSRSAARAGDLVVGPGHVGIYMGGGMMIDAGNRRVGVSYRRMYSGLHVERVR